MRKCLILFVLASFLMQTATPYSSAQMVPAGVTAPAVNSALTEVLLQGVSIDPREPFKMDFIMGTGKDQVSGTLLHDMTMKSVRYFLASLAMPKEEIWVNLSPYEPDRIIPDKLAVTEMGYDLLSQDYILKQITSALTSPDSASGKRFWDEVYKRSYELYGNTNVPVDVIHKVWIAPDDPVVYQKGNSAYIVNSHLKVMLEKDLVADGQRLNAKGENESQEAMVKNVLREVIVPLLEKEVNEGKDFALLRRIYRAHILADWYKQVFRKHILGSIYADKEKVSGIDFKNSSDKQAVYEQYLDVYARGAAGVIREEQDIFTNEIVPRKYFSGGMNLNARTRIVTNETELAGVRRDYAQGTNPNTKKVPVRFSPLQGNDGKGPIPLTFNKSFERMSVAERKEKAREILDDVDADSWQPTYEWLDSTYPGGSARAIYDAYYNKTSLDLVETKEMVDAARQGELAFYRTWQTWWENTGKNNPDAKFVWMFATGTSPEMMLKRIVNAQNGWNDSVRENLKREGINLDQKPDMTRVIAFHLDTNSPQKRTAYATFSRLVNIWCKQLGIPVNQRHLWYGDLIVDKDGKARQMSNAELKAVKSEIESSGFLKREEDVSRFFKGDEAVRKEVAEKHPHLARFLLAMQVQQEEMTEKLKQAGGPHLVLGSTGPSYEGLGHVAFIESGYGLEPAAFSGVAGHHNVAGQVTYLGGYSQYMGRVMYSTFAFPDIKQRQGVNFILIIVDKKKCQSLRFLMEGDAAKDFPRVPVLGVQDQQGVVLGDEGSMTELLYKKYPWDFRVLEGREWDDVMVRRYLLRVAEWAGKKLHELKADDIKKYAEDSKAPSVMTLVRQANLDAFLKHILKKHNSFEEYLSGMIESKRQSIIRPDALDTYFWGEQYVNSFAQVVAKRDSIRARLKALLKGEYVNERINAHSYALGEWYIRVAYFSNDKRSIEIVEEKVNAALADLIKGADAPQALVNEYVAAEKAVIEMRKTIVMPDPHPDDRGLAFPRGWQELLAKGHRAVTYTVTSGASAVGNEYIHQMLSFIRDEFSAEDFSYVMNTPREALMRQLLSLAKARMPQSEEDMLSFDFWKGMGKEERVLRAGLLLNYIQNDMLYGKGITELKQFNKFVEIIESSFKGLEDWGARNLNIVDRMKKYVRIIEEKLAMMDWGVAYMDIYHPLEQRWYTTVGKAGLPEDKDTNQILNMLRPFGRIHGIVSNSEGFSDNGGHEAAEVMNMIIIPQLMKEGIIDDSFKYVNYAGVWYRIPFEDANLTMVLTEDEMKGFGNSFWQIYSSQAPAVAPDPSWDDLNLFSTGVARNGAKSLDELAKAGFETNLPGAAAALNYIVVDVTDPEWQAKAQRKVQSFLDKRKDVGEASTQKLYGWPSFPDLKKSDDLWLEQTTRYFVQIGVANPMVFDYLKGYILEGTVTREEVVGVLNAAEKSAKSERELESLRELNGKVQALQVEASDSAQDVVGGIHFGLGGELRVIAQEQDGHPVVDPETFSRYQTDFKGLIPVLMGEESAFVMPAF